MQSTKPLERKNSVASIVSNTSTLVAPVTGRAPSRAEVDVFRAACSSAEKSPAPPAPVLKGPSPPARKSWFGLAGAGPASAPSAKTLAQRLFPADTPALRADFVKAFEKTPDCVRSEALACARYYFPHSIYSYDYTDFFTTLQGADVGLIKALKRSQIELVESRTVSPFRDLRFRDSRSSRAGTDICALHNVPKVVRDRAVDDAKQLGVPKTLFNEFLRIAATIPSASYDDLLNAMQRLYPDGIARSRSNALGTMESIAKFYNASYDDAISDYLAIGIQRIGHGEEANVMKALARVADYSRASIVAGIRVILGDPSPTSPVANGDLIDAVAGIPDTERANVCAALASLCRNRSWTVFLIKTLAQVAASERADVSQAAALFETNSDPRTVSYVVAALAELPSAQRGNRDIRTLCRGLEGVDVFEVILALAPLSNAALADVAQSAARSSHQNDSSNDRARVIRALAALAEKRDIANADFLSGAPLP